MSDPILSPSEKKRLEQDEKTVMAMAAVFCRGHHHICAQGEKLCPECAKVIDYSLERTRRCPHKHSGTEAPEMFLSGANAFFDAFATV